MTISSSSRLLQSEALSLYHVGINQALHEPIEATIGKKLRWLNLLSAQNVANGSQYMEVGVNGAEGFQAFLGFNDLSNWGLSEEQLTLLGAIAKYRQTAEHSSASTDAELYFMSEIAIDLAHAA